MPILTTNSEYGSGEHYQTRSKITNNNNVLQAAHHIEQGKNSLKQIMGILE